MQEDATQKHPTSGVPATPKSPWGTVFIAGVGRCGSTLLDMLLGAQEAFFSVGEVAKLSYYRSLGGRCTCGELVSQCAFWQTIEKRLRQRLHQPQLSLSEYPGSPARDNGTPHRNLPDPHDLYLLAAQHWSRPIGRKLLPVVQHFSKAADDMCTLFEEIRAQTGTRWIVDSSKEPCPMKHRYLSHKPEHFKLIYMVRDGRAIVNSTLHHEKIDIEAATHLWTRRQLNLELVMRSIPKRQILLLRYEDFCNQTASTMRTIGNFLGEDFSELSLTLDKAHYHNIAGSPSRFDRNVSDIQLDEKWRNQLNKNQLAIFNKHAGKLNRKLGYD